MTTSRADASNERLQQEFTTVVAETEQLLKSLATAGGDKAGALRDGVKNNLAAAGERLGELRSQAVAQADAARQATDDYVRENPWRAMGIIAAVAGFAGLVAGLLISRR